MASPQIEEGHLKIADSLVVAICRESFSATQLKILLAVMNMTYRVGMTRAQIIHDDMRYATGEKRYTIQREMGRLIDRNVLYVQHLVNGSRLVGLNKDYEKWLPKSGNANTSSFINSINNLPVKELPKFGNKGNHATPPGRILAWMLRELNIQLSLGAWRKEYGKMVELYTSALDLNHSPQEALRSLRDYFDDIDNPSFRARVTRPASYLLPGFRQWHNQIPKKPLSVKRQEEDTGYRFKYSTLRKQWERTFEKKPHS